MLEFGVEYGWNFIVVAEDYERCQRGIINFLRNRKEKICILKKTFDGNNHDENWQNRLFIFDRQIWADEFEDIAKKGDGWCFDPPILEYYSDIESCLNEWVRFDPWKCEVYTFEEQENSKTRRAYSLSTLSPESLEYGADWFDRHNNPNLRGIKCMQAICKRSEVISESFVFYGELSDKSVQDWMAITSPNDVLKTKYRITCWRNNREVIKWAKRHCVDEIQLEEGAFAWKCKGKDLINLSKRFLEGSVNNASKIEPMNQYGILYIALQ